MRAYHFVNEKFGLEDLRQRRIKIALLNELNDPFELFGINLSEENLRLAFRAMKDKLALNRGILCFSLDWHNPVLWSHYAEKHRGFCFGFDMPDQYLSKVSYTRKRLILETEQLLSLGSRDIETQVEKFLSTKYAHWRYENEARCFCALEDLDKKKKMYFAEFSDNLKLVKVIVGAESNLTRETIDNALGDLAPHVEILKASLSFKTFRVVYQKNQKLWSKQVGS
jgi:hypothetical protein